MRRDIPRTVFALALALLGAAGAVAYHSLATAAASADWVAHTYESKGQISGLMLDLRSAGRAQRNYLLTGERAQLEIYRQYEAGFPAGLDVLRALTADNPYQQARLAELGELAAGKFGLLGKTAALYGKGKKAEALAALEAGDRTVLPAMERTIAALNGEEDRLLALRRADLEDSLKGARFLVLTGGALGAGLLLLAFYFLAAEIKARELAEAALGAAREEAVAASKAKSAFIASMSHELRTPLNSVLGFGQILEAGYHGPLNAKQLEYVADINDAGRHLLALINDILDLAKIESGKMELAPENINVRELLERAELMFRARAAERGVKLGLKVAAGFPAELDADERKLKQVLFNLLSNAFKFTPAGGSVTLEAGPGEAGELEISVTDTGPGISPEGQAKLFAPFVQLDSAEKGTGLGLFLSRQMVALWGGRIGVVSPAPGAAGGCRFYFTLGKGGGHESTGGG